MSQFNYLNELNSVFTMDGEITRGPAPRWQKKLETSTNMSMNASMNTSTKQKLSVSYNNSYSVIAAAINNTKASNRGKKTPGKSPGRKTPTPNKHAVTPTAGDRFIPNRATTDFELANYMVKLNMQNKKEAADTTEDNVQDIKLTESQRAMSEILHGGDVSKRRILSYQTKAPAAPDSHQNPLRVVYSTQTPMSSKAGTRYIPSTPERILDAPDIINDYYLNLLDWSADNIVSVALGNAVFLWNAESGQIDQLLDYPEGQHACSLAWIQEGNILAVGGDSGTVELWDCQAVKRLRVMEGHTARVGSLAWNSFIVSSGSRDGSIIHHDVRQREHKVGVLSGHNLEVCGLKWSTNAKYLASGGNDNLVNIWEASQTTGTNTEPMYSFSEHQAAVRALAWCPWQTNVLASGGGTADRCIKFWNVNNGSLINSVDSKSQVCGLLWSKNYKELISAHGYANNQLTIWKYPSMVKQIELTGHTSRVLQIAMSPNGNTIMSAGADETLRIWECFAPDPLKVKKEKSMIKEKPSVFKQCIR